MPEQVKAVPPGFHALTPHLTVRNAEQALEFYKNAFGAERSCTLLTCPMERSCTHRCASVIPCSC
jgi:hypothetical protein